MTNEVHDAPVWDLENCTWNVTTRRPGDDRVVTCMVHHQGMENPVRADTPLSGVLLKEVHDSNVARWKVEDRRVK